MRGQHITSTAPAATATTEHYPECCDAMRLASARRNPWTAEGLQQGLTDLRIRERRAWFKPGLPREVQAPFRLRNRYRDTGADQTSPFWVRDYVFSPLEQAVKDPNSGGDGVLKRQTGC